MFDHLVSLEIPSELEAIEENKTEMEMEIGKEKWQGSVCLDRGFSSHLV